MGAATSSAGAEFATDAIDRAGLRKALGAFVTGVTVVSCRNAAGEPVGFTANSFTSVSMDPPLILACVARSAASYSTFEAAPVFAVSVLQAGQEVAARVFATRGADKFSEVLWGPRKTGAPVLAGTAAWFDCVTHERVEAGDHLILIGRVVEFGHAPVASLVYSRGGFASLEPSVRLVAAVVKDDRVLTQADGRGLRLPRAFAFGPEQEAASLRGQLARRARLMGPPTPFWSFEAADGVHAVAYRAEAEAFAASEPGWRITPIAEAVEGMACPGEAEALKRLARERA